MLVLVRKARLRLGLTVLVLLAVGAAALLAVDHSLAAHARQRHALEVRAAVGAFEAAIRDCQRAERGYVITGGEQARAGYDAAEATFFARATDLRRLVSDDPALRQKLDRADGLAAAVLVECRAAVETRRANGPVAGRDDGGPLDALFATTAELSLAASTAATEALAAAGRASWVARAAVVGSGLYGLVVALASLASAVGERVRRENAERALDEAHKGLKEEYLSQSDRLNREMETRIAVEEQFQLLVEGASDHAIFLLDRHGRVASWTAAAARIFGYSAKDAVGRPFDFFFPADEVARGTPGRLL